MLSFAGPQLLSSYGILKHETLLTHLSAMKLQFFTEAWRISDPDFFFPEGAVEKAETLLPLGRCDGQVLDLLLGRQQAGSLGRQLLLQGIYLPAIRSHIYSIHPHEHSGNIHIFDAIIYV